jgi:hypothetical protein
MLHAVCCTLHGVRCTSMLDVVRCGVVCCVLHGLRRMLRMLHVVCCMFTLQRVDCRHCCIQDFLPVKDFLNPKAGSAIPPLARSTPIRYPRPAASRPSCTQTHT